MKVLIIILVVFAAIVALICLAVFLMAVLFTVHDIMNHSQLPEYENEDN